MPHSPERRRKQRKQTVHDTAPTWVTLQNVPGRAGEVRAKVIDASEVGLGIHLPFWLRDNEVVVVNGLGGPNHSNGKVHARVVRCGSALEGGYYAGLTFEPGHEPPSEKPSESPADYYELLQVSPNADPEMIHRVFRLLAQRYHPDNTVTGDQTAFRAIADAYKTLSDPEKRAAYDVHLQSYRQQRWKIFDQKQASVGKLAEKSKRKGILELLYTTRRNQPSQPTLNLHELEDLLGCPREHLEFSLWYLRENGLIVRADNGRFAVTVKGVDWAEQQEIVEIANNRLLPAGDTKPEPN
jgi:hypothetical protein